MANIAGQKISGSLGSATVGTPFQPIANKPFNINIGGTFVGTAQVVRSFDGGTTWLSVLKPDVATAASFTAPANFSAVEPDASVLWAIQCTAFTSGSITYSFGS